MKRGSVTYDDMESAVRRTKSARWMNAIKTLGALGKLPRNCVVGAPGIEFKSTGFRVQLRPDLPGIQVL